MNIKLFFKSTSFAVLAAVLAIGCINNACAVESEGESEPQLATNATTVAEATNAVEAAETVDTAVEASGTAEEKGVRLSAWNMKWFPAGRPVEIEDANAKYEAARIRQAARFILGQGSDIFMFEEMRNRETVDGILAAKFQNGKTVLDGFKYNVISEFPRMPDATLPTHQNGVFSRFDAVDSGWKTYGKDDSSDIYPPRGYAYAVLDVKGHLIACISIHLKSNFIDTNVYTNDAMVAEVSLLNRKMRESSAKKLVKAGDEFLAKNYDGRKVEAVFIAGDFNTSIFDPAFEGEKTIQTLLDGGFKDCFADVPQEKRYTMPKSRYYEATLFDYIFVKGDVEVKCPEVSDMPVNSKKRALSDHQMVNVVFFGDKAPVKRLGAESEKKPEGKAEPAKEAAK